MLKIDYGWIGNTERTKTNELIVRTRFPNTFKDVLIGGTLVVMGITYLTATAFKYGADKYVDTEYRTMRNLGIVTDDGIDISFPQGKWCK